MRRHLILSDACMEGLIGLRWIMNEHLVSSLRRALLKHLMFDLFLKKKRARVVSLKILSVG